MGKTKLPFTEEHEKLREFSSDIMSFFKYVNEFGVQLAEDNCSYCYTNGVVIESSDILFKLLPNLKMDKEGLFCVDDLLKISKLFMFLPGMFEFQEFYLFSSPFLRRGYCFEHSFPPLFLGLFLHKQYPNCQRFISLDKDRIRLNVKSGYHGERDTWYGAKFDKNIMTIPDGNTKLRPPGYLTPTYIKDFFGDAYSLDIKWGTKDGIKSFQLEEFKTDRTTLIFNGELTYPVRYVHAEYDLDNSEFRHFDGSIHSYTEAEYYARRDSDFNYNSKNAHQIKTDSIKLFKINGNIPVETWSELTSHFLHGNPLILEYFEGKYPKHIVDFLARIRELGRSEMWNTNLSS